MTAKPPTVAQLLRKIERMEARLVKCEATLDKTQMINREHMYDAVDYTIRMDQAVRILRGEE